MTEPEWPECDDPVRLLQAVRGKASRRKLRLFAAACYRSVWSLLPHEADRAAVPVMEDHADGAATDEQLLRAYAAVHVASSPDADDAEDEADAYLGDVRADAETAAAFARSLSARTQVAQAGLLRCIFGNPFRPVALDPAWLVWRSGTIPRLAQAIYDERAFDRLPVLADALEEAGCTDADLLGHLRLPAVHVRGCFAVDAVLRKE
jgi:hypothetical protein